MEENNRKKLADLSPVISIIALNINELNTKKKTKINRVDLTIC